MANIVVFMFSILIFCHIPGKNIAFYQPSFNFCLKERKLFDIDFIFVPYAMESDQ